MASRPKEKMSIENRAKQFSPFSALRGLEEALIIKEIEAENRSEIKYVSEEEVCYVYEKKRPE